jgi:N-acetyl sugar amidotransferase
MKTTNLTKHDVRTRYNLPAEVRFCRTCTISNQRPRITFDEHGVCSACRYAEYKKGRIDWKEREKELIELCNRFRRHDGSFDVIVPCSGGKDGAFVAHQLKYTYGMNPLTVTWAPLLPTEIGRKNLDSFIDSGFTHVKGSADGKVARKLTYLSFKYLGDPFQPFIYGVTNFPLRIATRFGISLIMYGENGEVEYGGDMKNAFRPSRDIDDHNKHYFSGMPPEVWTEHGVTLADLYPLRGPDIEDIRKNKTEIHFMGYYKHWDPQENFYYAISNTGFTPNPERSEGTYSKYPSLDDKIDGFHYYLGYIKFGIGRATSDSAHEIRDEKITREEGVALVKRYDGEFPAKYFQEFLEFCSMSEDEFWEVVDSWRSDHLWHEVNGEWKLKKRIWE